MLKQYPKKKQKEESYDNQKEKPKLEDKEKRLFFWRIVINIVLSLILLIIYFIMWKSYTTWKLFFSIVLWSFWSNTFYILSITIIDICLYKGKSQCEKFNYKLRNYFLRIFFPFSIGTVIIYWELILLGEKYQSINETVLDIVKNFFIHGLVLIFVLFDIFTAHHVNKNNNCKRDIIIISIIIAIHFSIVIICKEFLNIYQWDFLIIADFRQIIASFIIMYLIIMNGYVILYLISDNFFDKDEIDDKNEDKFDINNENNYNEKNFEEKIEENSKKKENNDEKIAENKQDEKNEENKNEINGQEKDEGIEEKENKENENKLKEDKKNEELPPKNKLVNKKKFHIIIK